MKKKYLFAEAELILILSKDVITTSSEDEFVEENDQEHDDQVSDNFTPRTN